MALKGNLKDLALADLLSLLSQQNKSGHISISNEKNKAVLTLNRGDIVHVSINKQTPETKIKRALLQSGRLKPAVAKELEQQAIITGNSPLALLVSKGIIQKEDLQAWIQISAEELAMSLISWTTGEYEFESESTKYVRKESSYYLQTDFIILEGLRQSDEWSRIQKSVPSEKTMLRVAKQDYREYELGQDIYIMEAIKDGLTIKVLQTHLPFNSYRLYNSVVNLVKEGFLTISHDQNISSKRVSIFFSWIQWQKKTIAFCLHLRRACNGAYYPLGREKRTWETW